MAKKNKTFKLLKKCIEYEYTYVEAPTREQALQKYFDSDEEPPFEHDDMMDGETMIVTVEEIADVKTVRNGMTFIEPTVIHSWDVENDEFVD